MKLGAAISQKPAMLALQVAAAGLVVLSLLVVSAFVFTADSVRERARDGMVELAAALGSQVDVAAHERLVDARQMDGMLYRDVIAPLVRSHEVVGSIRNIYTLRLGDDGRFRFVLDTASSARLRNRGTRVAPLMSEMAGADQFAEFDAFATAIREGRSYIDTAAHLDSGLLLRSVSVPLRDRHGVVIGALGVDYEEQKFLDAVGAWVAGIFAIAEGVAVLISLLLAVVVFILRHGLGKLLDELGRQSVTDALTGVFNRRRFSSDLWRSVAHARRQEQQLSLLLIDIDRFKTINDSFGHAVGDAVLRKLASVLAQIGRTHESVYRIGGEEFAILLPHASADEALALYQRLRDAVARKFPHPGAGPQVTLSAGVAQLHVADEDQDHLFRRADQALYRAKNEGRDRCHVG